MMLFSLLVSVLAQAAPNVQSWEWRTSDSPSYLTLTDKELRFQSSHQTISIIVRPCSAPAVQKLKNEFESKIKNFRPERFPATYEPIQLKVNGQQQLNIFKGTDLGLYLMRLPGEVEKIQYLGRALCDRS